MLEFKLANITKEKYDSIPSKLPPITDIPTVDFMQTLDKIDNEYSSFSLLLIIVVSIFVMLTASPPLFFLCIQQNVTKM